MQRTNEQELDEASHVAWLQEKEEMIRRTPELAPLEEVAMRLFEMGFIKGWFYGRHGRNVQCNKKEK